MSTTFGSDSLNFCTKLLTKAYKRPLTETFRYAHTMQHGTPEECAALLVQANQEQRQVVQQAAQQQQQQHAAAQQYDVTPASQKPAPEQATTPAVERPAPRPERKQSRGI